MSDEPRLLFCCFEVVPGPHPLSRRLTEYLKVLGGKYETVVISKKDADKSHIERYYGARLLRVPMSGDFQAQLQSFERALKRQLESEEYSVVHCFEPFGGYVAAASHAELGYGLVYDALSFPSVDLPSIDPAYSSDKRLLARARRQELFCLMNADAVLLGSQVSAAYVRGLGIDDELLHPMRAPVDLAPYQSTKVPPDGKPMRLLHLGSEAAYHELHVVIEAMALAAQKHELKLTVIGPQSPVHHPALQRMVEERHLTTKVDFQPPVAHDDLYKVVAAADVGLLTVEDGERSRVVGASLARAAEYLAGGRPIIAADLPLVRELVPAEACIFYHPGDARSLAQAMATLAALPAKRVTMGDAARRTAALHDAGAIVAQLASIYRRVGRGLSEPAAAPDAAAADEPTQQGARAGRPDTGTNKVKTDPAIAHGSDTESAAAPQRGPIMGVPLDDEVADADVADVSDGPAAGPADDAELADDADLLPVDAPEPVTGGITEETAVPSNEHDTDSVAAVVHTPDAPPPVAPAPFTGVPERLRPTAPPLSPRASAPPAPQPRLSPLAPSAVPLAPAPLPALGQRPAPPSPFGRPVPILSPDAAPLISPARPSPIPPFRAEDAAELSDDDVVDDPAAADAPGSALDVEQGDAVPFADVAPMLETTEQFWLGQLVHGYVPPEDATFNRHTPPTTMPGRDT